MSNTQLIDRLALAELLGVRYYQIPRLVVRGALPPPVRGACPAKYGKQRIEDRPLWDKEAALAQWVAQ